MRLSQDVLCDSSNDQFMHRATNLSTSTTCVQPDASQTRTDRALKEVPELIRQLLTRESSGNHHRLEHQTRYTYADDHVHNFCNCSTSGQYTALLILALYIDVCGWITNDHLYNVCFVARKQWTSQFGDCMMVDAPLRTCNTHRVYDTCCVFKMRIATVHWTSYTTQRTVYTSLIW